MNRSLTRSFCALALSFGAGLLGCVGTAGGELVQFTAQAAGPLDADGGPLRFTTRQGYEVELTSAELRIGAVYLNDSVPLSSERASSCLLDGVYVAEITQGALVNLLQSTPVQFPAPGVGIVQTARIAEVWLTGTGVVDADIDRTPVFTFAGEARKDGARYPFSGRFTIGDNRVSEPSNPAMPGASPICQERIVTGIRTTARPREGGTLTVRADPRAVFRDVHFDELSAGADGVYAFEDRSQGQPSTAAYQALRAATGVYSVQFE